MLYLLDYLNRQMDEWRDKWKKAVRSKSYTLVSGFCGRLLLQDSGTIDLRNVTQTRCIFAIGRPLDEVIQIKIISSTLNCQQSKYSAYISDRQESDAVLVWWIVFVCNLQRRISPCMTDSSWCVSVRGWLVKRWNHDQMSYWCVRAAWPLGMECCYFIRV